MGISDGRHDRKNGQWRFLYRAKVPFKNRGIKTLLDKQKTGEFVVSRPVLQEILKGVLQAKMKGHQIMM